MLNPRSFFADCMRSGKMRFWQAGLPWEAINSAIDNSTFRYEPGPEAMENFRVQTLREWNNLDEPDWVDLICLRCLGKITAPLTSYDNKLAWTTWGFAETGTGFAETGFQAGCERCSFIFDHNVLRLEKFRGDLKRLISQNCPMPGTFLTIDGTVPRHVNAPSL